MSNYLQFLGNSFEPEYFPLSVKIEYKQFRLGRIYING